MDMGFYVIILFLIFLKLIIWVCVFYSRAQRRQALLNQRIIISDANLVTRSQHGHGRDQDAIITNEHVQGYPGGFDNPGLFAPPTYDEVQRDKSVEQKPPSYEQVVSGSGLPSNANLATIPTATGVPVTPQNHPGLAQNTTTQAQ